MDANLHPMSHYNFHDLLAEVQQRYRDLKLQNDALVTECGRLRQFIEALLGVYGKYVDAEEIARWRALATVGLLPAAI